jgi:hypothetical protein
MCVCLVRTDYKGLRAVRVELGGQNGTMDCVGVSWDSLKAYYSLTGFSGTHGDSHSGAHALER